MSHATKVVFIVLGICAGLFVGLTVLAICAAIALPAYTSYLMRAEINEAFMLATTASQQVTLYVHENQRLPDSLAQIGHDISLPDSIQYLDINPESAQIQVIMRGRRYDGQSFVLSPSVEDDGQIIWTCINEDLHKNDLPSQCR